MRLDFDPARKYQEILNHYQLLDKINQHVSLIVYILDVHTLDVHFTTQEIQNILGYEHQEIQEMDIKAIRNLFFPQDLHKFIQHLNTAKELPDNEVAKIDYRMYRKDGKLIWLQNKTLVFERDALGKSVKLLGIAEDITERIEFIETLQERNKQLEEIAWLNAHEIRRPVASILGLMSLLDKENLANPQNQEIIALLEKMVKELDIVIGNISVTASLHRKK